MRLRYVSLALLISLGVSLRPAQADSPNAPVTTFQLGGTSPITEEDVTALVKMYDALDKLMAFHVEYLVPDTSDQHLDLIRVAGDLQRPNKMNLRLFRKTALLGQIVSDGVNMIIYNGSTNEYISCRMPLSGDISMIGWQAVNENNIPADWSITNILFPRGSQQVSAIFGAQYLLQGNIFSRIDHLNITANTAKLTAKPSNPAQILLEVLPLFSRAKVTPDKDISQFNLDSSTNLPAKYVEISHNDVMGHDVEESLLYFEQMKVKTYSGILPAAAFAWPLPPGASSPSERPFNHKGHDYTEPRIRLIKPIE